MSMVGEMRTNDRGVIEVCTRISDPGGIETWEPYVSVYVRSRALPDRKAGYFQESIDTHLREAGWIAPDDELESHLCLAGVASISQPVLAHTFRNRQCLRRRGHPGWHQNGNFSWEDPKEVD